jgi:ATPase subunit of ABC transporter with duplicated ATPase domains
MASLVASGVAIGHGANVLAERIDLTVVGGRAIGLVGPNGAGKSTLLRVLAGIEPPLRGEVRRSPRTSTIGFLEQLIDPVAPDETTLEWLARRTGVADATAVMEASAADMATDDPTAADRYSDALERWLALGGADFDDRAAAALSDVGLATDTTVTVASLSGGQRARLGLASLIVARHDVHLLDEPTNDLDLVGLARMEKLVVDELSRGAGVVVVSHDRAFLEAVTTDIVELDPLERRATSFSGGYAAYVLEREIARRRASQAFDEYRSRREQLESRARTTRQWAERGVRRSRSELDRKGIDPDKIGRRARAESAERQAGRASQLELAIERLEAVDAPQVGWQLRYSIEAAPRSGTVVATLRDLTVDRGTFRLGPVDLDLTYGERVAIIGPNGAGKSTLLSLLLGRLEPTTGTVTRGSGVVVGEIDPSRASIDGDRSLVESFLAWYPTSSIGEVRTLLAKFDLTGDDVLQPARRLSPGERTRATLARFQHDGVNLLVLDEPTNHLDLPAIEQLEAALDRYAGTLLLISHDRRLLEAVRVDHQWHVDTGRVTIR